jgi:glycosyltransferase involved in cell wall biosynthesis
MSRPRPADPLLSVVVPVLDEEACIDELARRVREAWRAAGVRGELLFVDDGSRDATPARLAALRAGDPSVKSIRFTRTFGHQAALAAGLRFARGDAVVTLDGDLQHPPELLPDLVRAWRAGADVVHAVRTEPAAHAPVWKERASRLFYAVLARMSATPVVPAGADFRLLDRRVVDALNGLEEHFVFVRGLVPWLGFSETRVPYAVEARYAGRSKYRLRPLLQLALDGLVSFSVLPLRVIGLLGALTVLFGVGFGVFALAAELAGRVRASGWTSLVVLVLVFGGVQLLSLGVVSEYVGRIYEEVKHRPRYVIDRVEGVEWP